jgi:hypothetical protein
MAIAIFPDGPRTRWERIGLALLTLATVAVVALLVALLIVEYVI